MGERQDTLRVIIAGAGIAGLATAISLSQIASITNIDIQLYEQAPELLEIGASIALSPNGMRTLEKLGVDKALTDEFGYRGPSGIPQIFRHWKTDQVISVDTHTNVPNPRHHTTRFHRGHLHAALLEHVPRESIHLGKKIIHAEADKNGVTLHFEDGSSVQGDVLIGADGIRSAVRKSFLPDYRLRFSGKVFMRSTFDASLVEGKIPNLPSDSMHWTWYSTSTIPHIGSLLMNPGKDQYTTVGAYDDPRTEEELENSIAWNQRGNVEFLREKYKMLSRPGCLILGSLSSAMPHTPMGGAFAAGGSLALDDTLALGLAFRHVFGAQTSGQTFSSENIKKALGLYSNTRQPHTARILRIVHNQIDKRGAQFTSAEEEDEALVARMRSRPNTEWLSEHDVEAAFAATLEQVEVIEASDQAQASKSTKTVPESSSGTSTSIQLEGSKL
ncbi:Monooxygenase FAD-binding [Penicillium cosmopolitanum]|uniref:Monooxygenase FAD-binding n=1 Tax=Penicillium cosmopolitanum TaxID=1131564 RepID=A0A9W9VY76_9EURO|nr:Monooxygenase FAD-binding [Penicillium cosmopolitanum]KAJ5391451.1 Monooxygenase FAD-binding [Penicillium cosmopolitanum]